MKVCKYNCAPNCPASVKVPQNARPPPAAALAVPRHRYAPAARPRPSPRCTCAPPHSAPPYAHRPLDSLVFEPRRRSCRDPPRRKLVLLILVPQPPILPIPKTQDTAALRHYIPAPRSTFHHQHRVVVSARATSAGVVRSNSSASPSCPFPPRPHISRSQASSSRCPCVPAQPRPASRTRGAWRLALM